MRLPSFLAAVIRRPFPFLTLLMLGAASLYFMYCAAVTTVVEVTARVSNGHNMMLYLNDDMEMPLSRRLVHGHFVTYSFRFPGVASLRKLRIDPTEVQYATVEIVRVKVHDLRGPRELGDADFMNATVLNLEKREGCRDCLYSGVSVTYDPVIMTELEG